MRYIVSFLVTILVVLTCGSDGPTQGTDGLTMAQTDKLGDQMG